MAIQIKGVDFFPNTSFEFDGNGMYIKISLNIPEEIKKFLYAGNVHKSKERTCYALRSHIMSKNINKNNVKAAHGILMRTLMFNIRIAKIKQIDSENELLKGKGVLMGLK